MFKKEYRESPSNSRYSDYLTDFPPHAIIADISIEIWPGLCLCPLSMFARWQSVEMAVAVMSVAMSGVLP